MKPCTVLSIGTLVLFCKWIGRQTLAMQRVDNSAVNVLHWVHAFIRHYLTTGRKYALSNSHDPQLPNLSTYYRYTACNTECSQKLWKGFKMAMTVGYTWPTCMPSHSTVLNISDITQSSLWIWSVEAMVSSLQKYHRCTAVTSPALFLHIPFENLYWIFLRHDFF